MFWNLLNVQKILDELFDDGWCSLGVPELCIHCDAELLE